jgi:hypothetical protein
MRKNIEKKRRRRKKKYNVIIKLLVVFYINNQKTPTSSPRNPIVIGRSTLSACSLSFFNLFFFQEKSTIVRR